MNKKVVLIIMDGWGIGGNDTVSAISQANTPYVDSLYKNYPHSRLEASGKAVGLPAGQMGNSEVGHMNIGAGRVVYQELERIHNAIDNGEMAENEILNKALNHAKENKKKVHFIGLLSDGGVHSHIRHLKGLLSIAAYKGMDDVYVHAFTDGRDTDPKGGEGYLQDLQQHMNQSTGKLATVIGRYYAMDRDRRWERVKLAYDAMVHGIGDVRATNAIEALKEKYAKGETDEFIRPIIMTHGDSTPVATIQEGDVVICYNFRTDRGRQITMALTQEDFPEQNMQKMDLYYVTMTRYDEGFRDVEVLLEKAKAKNTLGEVLARNGKRQIRIAETEKYPHVTFFFNGGREEKFVGEERILCPSPMVATYDLQPEMSAYDIRDAIVAKLKKGEPDFVCLNFANPDMVGHTGDFYAAVKACETVDECTRNVTETALENGYTCIIFADHGNADFMVNGDGSPNTAHTTNLVPCFLVDKDLRNVRMKDGKLGDIAPTVLKLMGLDAPEDMTGNILFE